MYDLDSRKDIMRLYSDYHQRLTGSYGSERAILAELLEEETITGWHATRVLSADDIAEMGLKAFSREEAFDQFRYLSGVVGLNLGQTETVLQKANHYLLNIHAGLAVSASTCLNPWPGNIQNIQQRWVGKHLRGL